MRAARIASVLALAAGLVLAFFILLGGSSGHSYHVIFETGGQLVKGNQVLVAGQPVGTIDDITLTDDAQADVQITVDEPLHEGTTAVIRATSLSGIANRYISLDPGPNNADEMDEGGTLTADETTAPVDLDQLFNTLDAKTRKALQKVVQGSATLYAGNNKGARESYKYFAPSLQSTQRLLEELTRDEQTFSQFLVTGGRALGAIADRRDDLSALTENANNALGAIAAANTSLDRSLAALAPTMRQANTTFVNLRAAFDDLDPLVATSKEATKRLPEFLRALRPVARKAVPVVGDLRLAVDRSGPDNDLSDVLLATPGVEKRAAATSRSGIRAVNRTQDDVSFARPYIPDLMAFISHFGQAASNYNGNGHYLRAMPSSQNLFDYQAGALVPIPKSQQYDFFNNTPNSLQPFGFLRCPGAATEKNAGWAATGASNDHPFLDDGRLSTPDECDPSDTPYGVYGPPGP